MTSISSVITGSGEHAATMMLHAMANAPRTVAARLQTKEFGLTYTDFRFKTFIPEQYVAANPVCNGGSIGFDRYVGGDNRSWSATSTATRTYADVQIVWNGTSSSSKSVGQTRPYQTTSFTTSTG